MWQFSFLNTGVLIFAAATILPLLIWLLAKRKPIRIVFSSIRFIKRTEKEQKSRTKLKNILLLIIRMLIILLVALAASRPSLKIPNRKPGKQHPPTAIAILIDTSYSMDYMIDGKSSLEYAKNAAKEINARTNNNDLLVLISSDANWNRINAQIHAGKLPENLINSLKTTWQPLSMDKMYELAKSKLSDSQLTNREILFISDRQDNALPAKPDIPISIIPLPDIRGWNNISCTGALPDKQITEKQQTQNIRFELNNHGSSIRKDVLVRVDFNGVKAAEKFVTLSPGQKLTETLPVNITASGWQSGFIEVLDEKLTADNRSYFTFPYELHPALGVITSRNSLPMILQSLMSVYATPKGSIRLINPAQVSLQILNDITFLAVYDAGDMSPRLRQVLSDWSSGGKGILYIANRDLGTGWKAYYTQQFGCTLKEFSTGSKPLSFINKYHLITSLIDTRQIKKTSVSDYWDANTSAKSEVLLSADKSPFALVSGKDALWLFDPASLGNRFFLEAAFPVFAIRCFEYLANQNPDSTPVFVGQSIQADRIILPDNKDIELNGNSFTLSEPGVYSLQKKDEKDRSIAVNADIAESNYKPLDIPKHSNFHYLKGKWQEQLFLTRLGHDLWKYLLLTALVLLMAEIFIVKSEEWKKDR